MFYSHKNSKYRSKGVLNEFTETFYQNKLFKKIIIIKFNCENRSGRTLLFNNVLKNFEECVEINLIDADISAVAQVLKNLPE